MVSERSRARSGAWLRPPLLRLSQATLCPISRRGQYVGALHERSLDLGPSRRSTLSVPYADGTLARQNTLATTWRGNNASAQLGQTSHHIGGVGIHLGEHLQRASGLDTDLFVAIVERVDAWSRLDHCRKIPNSHTDH
jgi:hypothetical protein